MVQYPTQHSVGPTAVAQASRMSSLVERLEPRVLFASVQAGFADEQVVTGLSNPTAMEFAPDGRLFVCQQGGPCA